MFDKKTVICVPPQKEKIARKIFPEATIHIRGRRAFWFRVRGAFAALRDDAAEIVDPAKLEAKNTIRDARLMIYAVQRGAIVGSLDFRNMEALDSQLRQALILLGDWP